MNRIVVFIVVSCLIGLSSLAAQEKPNVLVFIVDDLRAE